MDTMLVEHSGSTQRVYETAILEPRFLPILAHPLAMRIIQSLSLSPACPLDLARSLQERGQKVYYACRKLEAAGIIQKVGAEKRFGMTANIYGVVSPTVAAKLVDQPTPLQPPHHATRFLSPFITNRQFNGLVVFGDNAPHGQFGMSASEGHTVFEVGALLGTFLQRVRFPLYKRDTHVTDADLQQNLIVVGHPRSNTVLDKLNANLPAFFDPDVDFAIRSRRTNQVYPETQVGVFAFMKNPFDTSKRILVLAGRTRGTRAAAIALVHRPDILGDAGEECYRIVKGIDRDGDGVVDDVVRLE